MYLTATNISHVAQSSNAVHAYHIVAIHLSPQQVVHDLLCQGKVVLAHSTHQLQCSTILQDNSLHIIFEFPEYAVQYTSTYTVHTFIHVHILYIGTVSPHLQFKWSRML